MEITIRTSELQDMVSKVIKCSSNNKLLPLTSLMSIKVESNFLTLATTDGTNYFYSKKEDRVDCEDFEVSVMAELFTKLVQKTTAEEIKLTIENGILSVKGNGTYKVELPFDENGNPIKFPKKIKSDFREEAGSIKLSTIKNVINANKPSLAVNMEYPALTCYYCGDSVITSDRKKICDTAIKMFEKPMLITSTLMELLGSVSMEDIEVTLTDDDVVFTSGNDTIYAPITEGVDTFPVEAILGLVKSEFASSCKIAKTSILNIIDRLSLFVSPYDKRGIYLTFSNEGIMLRSKKSSGEELIPFIESNNFNPYTCCIDIEMLRSQIATCEEDTIEIHYGSEIAIKLVNKNIVQIVALLEDDRMEA